MCNMSVELIDHMGTDLTPVNAARVSMNKASDWEIENIVTEVDADSRVYHEYPILKLKDKDAKLISYLASNGHTSCFEHQVASFRLKVPIFVARQIQRHRAFAYNEVSRRYVKDDLEFYWPDKWRKAAANVKQGSSDEAADDQRQINYHAQNACHGALLAYKDMLAVQVSCRERDGTGTRRVCFCRRSLMTTFYMTGSLRNWAHFLKLRLDSHAQQEVREVAQMINDVLVELWPISMKELMK
jgi:thymidylate synthase (FAD)